MPVNWPALFDEIGVEYAKRGRNTSNRNINVQCPWCGIQDPSQHLAVAVEKDAYFCFREPRHSGTSLPRLLIELGRTHKEAIALLNRHSVEFAAPKPKHRAPPAEAARQWQHFLPARGNETILRYLDKRGFRDPEEACIRFDLRYALAGVWAHRMLIPIRLDDEVKSWTGRALRKHMQPKYLSHTSNQSLIYTPGAVRGTLVIVEGPLDALRIVDAAGDTVCAVAVQGKAFSDAKMIQLRDYSAGEVHTALLALDADVPVASVNAMVPMVRQCLLRFGGELAIARLALPSGSKDAAEMTAHQIRQWLRGGYASDTVGRNV